VDTIGYKQDQPAFKQVLARALGVAQQSDEELFATQNHIAPYGGAPVSFVATADMGKDFSKGRLISTGNQLDFSIASEKGFFSVNTPQGERFTRAGAFRINQERRLVTSEGFPVNGKDGSPVQIEGQKLSLAEDGTLVVDGKIQTGLKVVTFPHTDRLQKLGGSLFAPVDAENTARILEDVQLVQGYLETSNVEIVREMTRMIEANRAYTAMQQALTAADELNQKAISLAQV
jgi:flagellar basal body rod protein FlgG